MYSKGTTRGNDVARPGSKFRRMAAFCLAALACAYAFPASATIEQIEFKSGTNLLVCVNPKCVRTAHVQRGKTTTYTVYGDNIDWTTSVAAGSGVTVTVANKSVVMFSGRLMGKADYTFVTGAATPGERTVTINWRNAIGLTGQQTFRVTVLRNPAVQSVAPLQVTAGRTTGITIRGSDLGQAKIADAAGASAMTIATNAEDRIDLQGTWASTLQQSTRRLAIGQQASALLLVKAADITILPDQVAPVYQGCYVDQVSRLLAAATTVSGTMTNGSCQTFCKAGDYKYSGTEYSNQCFCGNSLTASPPKAPESECNMACSGAANQICGGTWRLSIYSIK